MSSLYRAMSLGGCTEDQRAAARSMVQVTHELAGPAEPALRLYSLRAALRAIQRRARGVRKAPTRHPAGLGANAARELPLKDGYFEMTLSRAFFQGNPKSITLNWIDFYR